MKSTIPLTLSLVFAACDSFGVACTSEELPGIAVMVVDSTTGAPVVLDSVLVTAIDGTYADTAQPIIGASLAALAHERAGTYSVQVIADGYQLWVRTNIPVSEDACHVETVSLVARLQR